MEFQSRLGLYFDRMLTKQRCTQTWPGRIMAQRFNIHNIVFASMVIVALLLLVIAETTDHWFIEAHSFETINQGLWKICYYFARTQTTLCVTPGAVSGMFEYGTDCTSADQLYVISLRN